MPTRKFKIGEPVYFRPAKSAIVAHTGHPHLVVSWLPPIASEYQYLIKNEHTEQELTAIERELSPVRLHKKAPRFDPQG